MNHCPCGFNKQLLDRSIFIGDPHEPSTYDWWWNLWHCPMCGARWHRSGCVVGLESYQPIDLCRGDLSTVMGWLGDS